MIATLAATATAPPTTETVFKLVLVLDALELTLSLLLRVSNSCVDISALLLVASSPVLPKTSDVEAETPLDDAGTALDDETAPDDATGALGDTCVLAELGIVFEALSDVIGRLVDETCTPPEPAPMQQRIIDMTKTAGSSAVPSATSAYLSMSITMLQKSFDKLREFNVVKTIDYRYAPCGSYIFMAKENAEFNIFSDPAQIRKALGEDGDDATAGLTGNSILQHRMSAYVDAIARRSRSIQINATMNHYERLGVARNASDREIRRSYRNLALKWHPDRIVHGSLTDQQKEAAEDIFKLLAESYEVLSNKESRSAYDTYLNRPPSRREEFMHYGTVDGITLDEAIATFKDAVDNITSTLHRVTDRFSSSSSTTVGHPLQHNAGKTPATTSAPGGHASCAS